MAEVSVRLVTADDEEVSRKLKQQFVLDIKNLAGVKTNNVNYKGDPVTIGGIVLAVVKSGALTKLIEIVGTYLSRDQRTSLVISTPSQSVTFSAATPQAFQESLKQVAEFFQRNLSADEVRPHRKVAILVANDEFEKSSLPPLSFTKNDLDALKEALEDDSCGFEVHPYYNANSLKIKTDLNKFCSTLTENDTMLFYYSGHGVSDGDNLYLVTQDTNFDVLEETSINTKDILERYLKKRAVFLKRKILILDCCYSGMALLPSGTRGGIADRKIDNKIASLEKSYGTYILTASSATEKAAEREKDGHGIFTKALLDGLDQRVRETLTIVDLNSYVCRTLTHTPQTPRMTALEQEGEPIVIANYKKTFEERSKQEAQRLTAKATILLNTYVELGFMLLELRTDTLRILEQNDVSKLRPQDRRFRNDVILFLEGTKSFAETFDGHPPRPEPARPEIGLITKTLVMDTAAELGSTRNVYFAPNIPEKKAINARVRTKMPDDEALLVLFDDTAFGSAKNCALIGETGIYWRQGSTAAEYIPWENAFNHYIEATGNTLRIGGKTWKLFNVAKQVAKFLMTLSAKSLKDFWQNGKPR